MRTLRVMVLMLLGMTTVAAAGMEQRYEIKSAEVTYGMSGSRQGTERLVFDDYGRREARFTDAEMSMFGMQQKQDQIQILDGEWMYNIDRQRNTATRMNYREMMERMTGKDAVNMKDFSEEMIKAMGGEKVGTEKILGRPSDVYTVPDMGYKVWVWKGIPLKYEVDMMGMQIASKATDIRENIQVDEQIFRLPEGLTVTDVDPAEMPTREDLQASREQMRQAQEMMNSPEYQEQMRQAQEMMNSPEYQQMMQNMQKMQAAQQEMPQNTPQDVPAPAENFATETVDGATNAAEDAVQDSVNDATRQGVKKTVGGMFRSMFK